MTRRIFAATWDHPRIRGEHRLSRRCFRHRWGSSPHTRGAPFQVCRCWLGWRIIPAYAGSTSHLLVHEAGSGDHPRIRGEHALALLLWRGEAGSSPHTRGARGRLSVGTPDSRIIPAYAGSTSDPPATTRRTADHPRIRGEHMLAMARFKWEGGSSPHTRGAHLRRLDGENEGGDHPRIRGEHTGCPSTSCRWKGSSPHTRGALRLGTALGVGDRIIPAYAGSTAAELGAQVGAEDHPRIRGEHGASYMFVYTNMRIIPAYAGSTGAPVGRSGSVGDHPRIRGEHRQGPDGRGQASGSSPHTRGALRS